MTGVAMALDLDLLERWLRGWSGTRGLPAPVRQSGGLMVEVGWPDQLRRHVFLDAGLAMQACARSAREAHVHIKAAVEPELLQRVLPPGWTLDAPRTLMAAAGPLPPLSVPAGYRATCSTAHGTRVLHLLDEDGNHAATGRLYLHEGCAVFDRIETDPAHRRRGLATAVMGLLDAVAVAAGAQERLLVASEQGRALYLGLGWQVLAPYSTAISPQVQETA